MAKFTERLTALRDAKGLKRQDAADGIGISRASLEYYEKGKRTPDIAIFEKIADFYNVSADYLLGRVDEQTRDDNLRFVCGYTGLNEVAVKMLKEKKEISKALNLILSFEAETELMSWICSYVLLEDSTELIMIPQKGGTEEFPLTEVMEGVYLDRIRESLIRTKRR